VADAPVEAFVAGDEEGGTVQRLSAAIVVNHRRATDKGKATLTPLPEEELAQLTALAKEAIGYSKERGDTFNVANAAFTAGGDVAVMWTGNDTQDFSDLANPEVTFYENFLTDYQDTATVATYVFTRGADLPPGNPGGNGTIERHQIGDGAAANEVVNELNGANGNLTLLLRDATTSVAATYAGITNNTWRGPTIVVFAAAGGTNPCGCAADYNQDGGVDGGDIETFFSEWEASAGCSDVNQDGGVDGSDIESFFQVWEAGGC
jgi:hypothetical protein